MSSSLVRSSRIRTSRPDPVGRLGSPAGTATKKEGLLGRGVVAPIYEGEMILENRLAAPGAGGGLAAIIPLGCGRAR